MFSISGLSPARRLYRQVFLLGSAASGTDRQTRQARTPLSLMLMDGPAIYFDCTAGAKSARSVSSANGERVRHFQIVSCPMSLLIC